MKKFFSITLCVMLIIIALGIFAGCGNEFAKVYIEVTNLSDNRLVEENEEIHIIYTSLVIDLTECINARVVKDKTNKIVKNAVPRITTYFTPGPYGYSARIQERGKYYVELTWNFYGELKNFGPAKTCFYVIVD